MTHQGQFVCQWCYSCGVDSETHDCSAFVPLYMLEGVHRKVDKSAGSDMDRVNQITKEYMRTISFDVFSRRLL